MAIDATQGSGTSGRTSVLGVWGARIVLIVVGACAIISVAFILFGAGGGTLSRVISTDVALILFALLVWLDATIGAYRPEWFELASLATDAYILLLWILIVWTDQSDGALELSLAIWHGLLCLVFVRGMLALVDLVRLLYGIWIAPVTRVLAYVAGCAFGAMALVVTIPAPYPLNGLWDYGIYGRIVASLAVIGGVSLVLVPLWGLLINRNRGARGPAAPYSTYGGQYPPSVPAAAPHPALAWPSLHDGRPVPVGPGGGPDFAAVAGVPLAWPSFLDGAPVPASPDGSPLFH